MIDIDDIMMRKIVLVIFDVLNKDTYPHSYLHSLKSHLQYILNLLLHTHNDLDRFCFHNVAQAASFRQGPDKIGNELIYCSSQPVKEVIQMYLLFLFKLNNVAKIQSVNHVCIYRCTIKYDDIK